jgi:hypothetical protein
MNGQASPPKDGTGLVTSSRPTYAPPLPISKMPMAPWTSGRSPESSEALQLLEDRCVEPVSPVEHLSSSEELDGHDGEGYLADDRDSGGQTLTDPHGALPTATLRADNNGFLPNSDQTDELLGTKTQHWFCFRSLLLDFSIF